MPRNAAMLVLFTALGLLAGCASREPAQPPPLRTTDGYVARPAAALVWTPPAARDLDPVAREAFLSREGRDEVAVLGYDLPVVMTLDVVTYDEQARIGWGWGSGGWRDHYNRRSVSTRHFVRYR